MLVISFLVAVISMAASLFTLYSTYWFPGELKVTLPYPGDNIGFSYDDRVKILIPISFTNTGSTRSRAQVYEIKAIISTPDGNKTKFETRWDYAASYISNQEYLIRYKAGNGGHKDDFKFDSEDQLLYEGRAVPFQVIGGVFITKLYVFAEPEMGAENPSGREATLDLFVETNSSPKHESVSIRKLPQMDSSHFKYARVEGPSK